MADHVFESRVWLARPRPEVFAFFAAPTALERLTPPAFQLRLVNRGVKMTAGAVLELPPRWPGVVPPRGRAFPREWHPPFLCVDLHVRGADARWEHRHRFVEEGGGTWVEDRVTYRRAGGPLGQVAHALLVKPLSAPAG